MPYAMSQILQWTFLYQNWCNIYANIHRKWIFIPALWFIVIGNCFYFRVSFHRHPLQVVQQWIFFLKATLSVASFSNLENMDFILSDFWVSISFMSLTSFIICCIQFSDGLPGLRWLVLIIQQELDLRAGVWGGRRRRWGVHFNLLLLIVMFQSSTSVMVYNCPFEMVLGHVLFNITLSCLLWNALIFSSICLVTVHSSLLYHMTEFMNAVNVLIFSLSDICLDLKISLRVFILSITSIFLLSMFCFVPSRLPSSLHFFQSGLLFLMIGW